MSRIHRLKDRLPFIFKANRILNEVVDPSLDVEFYRNSYSDLAGMTDADLEKHWVNHGKQEGRFSSLEVFIDKHSAKKTDLDVFDAEFYADFYGDISAAGLKSFIEVAGHYLDYGISEGRYPNFDSYLRSNGIGSHFKKDGFKFSEVKDINERRGVPVTYKMVLETLSMTSPLKISIFDEVDRNSRFYMELGSSFELQGDDEKAERSYCLSLIMGERKGLELLGNISLRRQHWKAAIMYYECAISNGFATNWAYQNIAKAFYEIHMPEQCMEWIVAGFRAYPEVNTFKQALDLYVGKYWRESQPELDVLANIELRDELIDLTEKKVRFISDVYAKFYTQFGSKIKKNDVRTDRVLIVGDYHIPQCIRYRINQKVEQLGLQGCSVEEADWTKIGDQWSKFTFVDVVIFYRVPAVPEVVKAMVYLRTLGKRTFYDIDDLLFTKDYPAGIDTFAGYVGVEQYRDLIKGMALFQSAIKRCEYGIASTNPLAKKVSLFVQSGKCYVHRNGMDKITKERGYQCEGVPVRTIFYGSGTQAHNSDFIEQALPALERVLQENSNVRLIVVGYLKLPTSFVRKCGERLILIPFVSDMDAYWSLVGSATINMAVLENDCINACKSELKWFEAAILGVPSVVSYTDNYGDVIIDGVDALVCHDVNDWYVNLNRLIFDESLREVLVKNSKLKIKEKYYPGPLSENIKNIISLGSEADLFSAEWDEV